MAKITYMTKTARNIRTVRLDTVSRNVSASPRNSRRVPGRGAYVPRHGIEPYRPDVPRSLCHVRDFGHFVRELPASDYRALLVAGCALRRALRSEERRVGKA